MSNFEKALDSMMEELLEELEELDVPPLVHQMLEEVIYDNEALLHDMWLGDIENEITVRRVLDRLDL